MFSTIIFVLILSLLILIHEFGHYIAAKKNNVFVEEFGFGLPPRAWGKKIGETIYSLNWLPFGGFVKLLGEEEHELIGKKLPDKLKNRTFGSKKPWQKTMIITAGVFMNFMLGWIIISFLFTQGVPVPSDKLTISQVVENSPAENAGLKNNDIVTNLFQNGTEYQIKSNEDFIGTTKKFAGKEIVIKILRNKEYKLITVTPRLNPPKGQGPLGIVISNYETKKYAWYEAPFKGLKESFDITKSIVTEFAKMILKLVTFQKLDVEVSGPVGIAKITGEAVGIGPKAVLQLLAILSLNLAVINILPFPALDGGRLVFVFYEWIFRKKANAKFERNLNLVGFAILITLIVVVTIADIIKLF